MQVVLSTGAESDRRLKIPGEVSGQGGGMEEKRGEGEVVEVGTGERTGRVRGGHGEVR